MAAPFFIGSSIYRGSSYGPRHPLAIPRVPTVIDLARGLGWLPSNQYRVSPRAKPVALQVFHTAEYVAAVISAEQSQAVSDDIRTRHGLGTLSNPVFPEMFRRPATAAGGSILAASIVAQHRGIVFNPGGGTHHGLSDRANGFCYFNDPVLAVMALRAQGIKRVVYLDIDAHHCDGVQSAFEGDDDLLILSTHEERRWPFTGALEDDGGGNVINLPLPRGTDDRALAYALDQLLLPAIAAHRPDAIVLQCGADAVREDPLARMEWSNQSHLRVVRSVMAMTDRLIVLGGGGYNPWTVARCWTAVWGVLNGFEMPDVLVPELSDILRGLSWNRKAQPDPALMTTLVDAPREGEVPQVIEDRVAWLRAQRGL